VTRNRVIHCRNPRGVLRKFPASAQFPINSHQSEPRGASSRNTTFDVLLQIQHRYCYKSMRSRSSLSGANRRGPGGGGQAAFGSEFREDMLQMLLNRSEADTHHCTDLSIGFSTGDPEKNIGFTAGEARFSEGIDWCDSLHAKTPRLQIRKSYGVQRGSCEHANVLPEASR
jgi:hypothetical protein